MHGKAVTVDCSPARLVLGAATKKHSTLRNPILKSFQLLFIVEKKVILLIFLPFFNRDSKRGLVNRLTTRPLLSDTTSFSESKFFFLPRLDAAKDFVLKLERELISECQCSPTFFA